MLHPCLPVLAASVFLVAGCVGTVDGLGGVDPIVDDEQEEEEEEEAAAADATPEVQEYTMTVSPPLGEMNLGDQLSFTATIDSENYEGEVTLSLTGTLPTWEVSYSPSETLTLVKDQSVDVLVTVTVPTNGDAGPGALAFALNGELGPRAGSATLNVANQVTVGIVAGAGEGGHGLGGTIAVRPGTDIIIVNNDNIDHRIHSEPHQEGSMGQGESFVMNYGSPGNESAYCHEHGENTGVLLITVAE